jgi:predicted P-loop ATPase
VLVFEGKQGVRKSTAARVLFEPFFTDDIADLGDKDSKITVASGNWCIELAEMDAASRKDVNTVKAFITRREDKFRAPYDRRNSIHPRQCVLLATTNDSDYLRDSTGGRRFWPVRIPQTVDADRLRAAKDQLWAEALQRYRDGAVWWIEPHEADLLGVVQSEQEERTAKHPWHGPMEAFLAEVDMVTVSELMEHCLDIPKGQWEQRHQTVIGRSLQGMGWKRKKIQANGVREWYWCRPEGGDRRWPPAERPLF